MKYRYERKYLVPNEKLEALRKRISPFVSPDLFANENQALFSEYTVRSIYFDSPNMDSLFEKKEGLEMRKKLRVRGYDQWRKGAEVFLEIKRKNGNRIAKNRAIVPLKKLAQILETGLDEETETSLKASKMLDDAYRFLFQMKKHHQQAVNLIVYDREPFFGIFDPNVRITFDKNIRSRKNPLVSDLFYDYDLKLVWPKHFILEVKYSHAPMPIWMKSIVDEFQLSAEALSKYAEGYYCHENFHA